MKYVAAYLNGSYRVLQIHSGIYRGFAIVESHDDAKRVAAVLNAAEKAA